MARPITFLSDYGLEDDFVGVCHAVMLRIAPDARIIDLTHGLDRHDIRTAALVLRRALPGVPRGRWVGATAGAAALAYLLGLTPSLTASTWAGWPAPLSASVAAVLGVILLGSIGTAQWWFLRGHLPRPWRWIGTTALGWLIGLGTFLAVAMPLWHPGQTLLVTVAVGLLAGTLMAGAMATVTGMALARMLRAP